MSTQAISLVSESVEGTLGSSFESPRPEGDTLEVSRAQEVTMSGLPIDRAEDPVRLQRWDQARERIFQTRRAARLLQEVNSSLAHQFQLLATHVLPGVPGDDMVIPYQFEVEATEVPPVSLDEGEVFEED